MFGTTVSGSSKGSEILVWDSDAPKTKPAVISRMPKTQFQLQWMMTRTVPGAAIFFPGVNFFSFHWTFVEVGECMVAYEPIDPQSLMVGEIFKASLNHPQKAHEQKNAQGAVLILFSRAVNPTCTI